MFKFNASLVRRFVARASLFSGGGDQCCEQDDKLNKMKSTGRLNILVNTTFELLLCVTICYIRRYAKWTR